MQTELQRCGAQEQTRLFQTTRPRHVRKAFWSENLILGQLPASQEIINSWAHIHLLPWKPQEHSRAGQGERG